MSGSGLAFRLVGPTRCTRCAGARSAARAPGGAAVVQEWFDLLSIALACFSSCPWLRLCWRFSGRSVEVHARPAVVCRRVPFLAALAARAFDPVAPAAVCWYTICAIRSAGFPALETSCPLPFGFASGDLPRSSGSGSPLHPRCSFAVGPCPSVRTSGWARHLRAAARDHLGSSSVDRLGRGLSGAPLACSLLAGFPLCRAVPGPVGVPVLRLFGCR